MSIAAKCICGHSISGFCQSDIKECRNKIRSRQPITNMHKPTDYLPRDTTPTFNELVSLIEKNFKGCLELSKAFTEQEIEDHWQRYKVVNRLGEAAGQGAVWVKASDRLPGSGKPVKWRINGNERPGNETIEQLIRVHPASFPEYEWLDESGVDPKKG